MFAIAIELLAERYTAMQFNDRSRPEWPPHPARLYSAMVAAWADSDEPDSGERAALCWLESQGAPEIHCGEPGRRSVVTHFVPVNDATALSRDVHASSYAAVENARQAVAGAHRSGDAKALLAAEKALTKAQAKSVADAAKVGTPTGRESASVAVGALQVLPENRGKQGRTYPTVIPDKATVWFVWPSAQPSTADRKALDGLLDRVARLGHSSTLVACRCDETGPATIATWVPGGAGEAASVRVRVPRPGLFDRLELAYQAHHGAEPRTLPAGIVSYRRPGHVRRQARVPHLGGDWYVLGFDGPRFPAVTQALAVAKAARGALLTHGEQPAPEIISGHQERPPGDSGPTPPARRTHLAVVPLLNAGNAHSDGTIFGIAFILPDGCSPQDRHAVEHALRGWAAADESAEFRLVLPAGDAGQPPRHRLQELGVDRGGEPEQDWVTPLTSRRKTTTRDYWCRPARRWLTVTPIALDRFPGNLRSTQQETRDRADAEAAAGIVQACVHAGLAAEPSDITRVTVRLDAPLVGIPASPVGRAGPGQRRFPGYRVGQGAPRACVHAEIEFAEPVRGPVLIGAGRFLGYGLCLPGPDSSEAR
ncbi:MAG: type I-G CRISPR-associated protein Csb2 [Trebonia sp.]